MTPVVNTHVHVPPNFSAFATPTEVIAAASCEGVRALGVSNFFDTRVYARIRDLAGEAGILALYGVEFITVVPDLAERGIRINDPANPGRMYLTGKGVDPFRPRSAANRATAAKIRQGNDQRAALMVSRLAGHFGRAGFETGLDATAIAAVVASRAGVPVAWVSLQERHIAQAFQEALWQLRSAERQRILQRVYDQPSSVAETDATGLQAELRARLLKAGTPGFAPEVPLSFEEAYAYILGLGGIPCYPVLADGCDPVCPFESSPEHLADELSSRGIYAAELIPVRNHLGVVDEFVRTLHEAGLIVMGGTEHNTLDRIPLDPAALDAPLGDSIRQIFAEAASVVAAHAQRVGQGRPGYVADDGTRRGGGRRFAQLVKEGTALIGGSLGDRPNPPDNG